MAGVDVAPALDHAIAAGEHVAERPGHVDAAVRRPVERIVDRLEAEPGRPGRIPDDEVGVGARRDRALPGQPEDPGGRGTRDLDQPLDRQRQREPDRQAGADARQPGGDLAEVAERLELLVEPQMSVVGGERV
jgi:hypothetical protein